MEHAPAERTQRIYARLAGFLFLWSNRESWAAWSENMLMHFNQPGVQMWWSLRKGSFRPSFRNFLESSPAPKVSTTVDVLRG